MDDSLCTRCKGKNLCGKPFCSIVARVKQYSKIIEDVGENFSGTSPPSCFVGRAGYPKVNLNILSPPSEDRYSWMRDNPSFWYSKRFGIRDILERRAGMVAVRALADVNGSGGRFLEAAREIAQSKDPVDAEYWLKKKPRFSVSFDSRMAPIGSPAEVDKVKLSGNVRVEKPVEKAVGDTDLLANDALEYLYAKNVDVNTLTKIISLGLLGLGTKRKLVPTRWSITAVDDAVSKKLIERVKDYHVSEGCMVFSNTYLGNHFEILLMPNEWQFEVIETKFPKSVWNPEGREPVMFSDNENYYGRKMYAANVTGAYYSARLGALEYLSRIKRQAAVLSVREVYPEYDTPMGVWVIRETVRGAFMNEPRRFASLEEAIEFMKLRLKLPFERYKKESKLLSSIRTQRTLREFG